MLRVVHNMKYLEHSDVDERIEFIGRELRISVSIDFSIYSTIFDDSKNRCDHYPLVIESVCLVIRDINDIANKHIWVVIVPKGKLKRKVGGAHKAAHDNIMSYEVRKGQVKLLEQEMLWYSPLLQTLVHWLVDQMHRDLDKTSGKNFSWDANIGRNEYEKTMTFVLLYSNLENKVLFEGRSIAMNKATVEDILGNLANYIWDPE
ncbi:hypothetical protein FXO38_06502 [Capsicum annuum]|nr:hypothetical protein FXO38_06502 [Capsicum annuum]